MVLSRQGSGLFVINPVPASVFRMPMPDFSNRTEIRNIIELLIAVEAAASGHAARRRTDEQMRTIDDCVTAMQQAIGRGESGVEEDLAFHRAIIEAADNAFFTDMSNFLDTQVRHFIRVARSNTSRSEGLTEAVQEEHMAICEAIRQQDDVAVRNAAEQHLQNAAHRSAIYLDERR
jgi:DNA-binding FadR family transcriptional regulator